ncbi:MAG: helix-turn-helix domain-containing protein, partial [Acidobacteriota bacterium]|nr:helix-turn-helix domain-containing protein [Acidobacteriota bacterium]
MPSQATAQKYLSTAQAAERWGVHPETIKRLIRDGSLPAYRLKRIL